MRIQGGNAFTTFAALALGLLTYLLLPPTTLVAGLWTPTIMHHFLSVKYVRYDLDEDVSPYDPLN